MLNVEIIGSGKNIVLLHGWGMNNAVWSAFARQLANDYCVSMIELPGHGDSPFNNESGIEQWAQACLDSAPEEAHWIGWSLGGMIATVAAAIAPERVSFLTTLSSNISFVQRPDWPHAMPVKMLGGFFGQLDQDFRKTLKQFLALQIRGATDARSLLRELNARLDAKPLASSKALKNGLDILAQADLREYLPKCQPACRWILSERDTLVPNAVMADIQKLSSSIRLTQIAGAAHAPFLSHADLLVELIHKDSHGY